MASTAMRTLIALLSTGGLPRLDFFALFIVGLSWFYDVIKQRAEQVLEYLFGPNPDHQGRNERHPGRTGPCRVRNDRLALTAGHPWFLRYLSMGRESASSSVLIATGPIL